MTTPTPAPEPTPVPANVDDIVSATQDLDQPLREYADVLDQIQKYRTTAASYSQLADELEGGELVDKKAAVADKAAKLNDALKQGGVVAQQVKP